MTIFSTPRLKKNIYIYITKFENKINSQMQGSAIYKRNKCNIKRIIGSHKKRNDGCL